MTQTTITAGDATVNNVAIQGGDDGTMVLKVGAAGSKVNALSFAADGTATLLKVPVNTTAQSMVRVNTANGYGSTNTVIRRFTNVVTNQGSDITYADSATLGGLFTINTNGVYAISYNDQFNTTQDMGISLNTSAPTTRISSIPVAEILASTYSAGVNLGGSCGGSFYLAAGSLIRAHAFTNGTGSNTALCQFTITRVA